MNELEIQRIGQNIPGFRGVFMRDNLPKKIRKFECAVVNLDSSKGSGTHWVAYVKRGKIVKYFDSFGNLQPPKEVVKYFGKNVKILYNRKRFQSFNSSICGKLALRFLIENTL